jgi:hypothetical protein
MSAVRPFPIKIWVRAMRVPYFTGAAMAVVCGAVAGAAQAGLTLRRRRYD